MKTFGTPLVLLALFACVVASLSHAESNSTNQFISALADLLERKVIGDDELLILIDAADEGVVPNPISEAKADTSVEQFVSRQMLQDYVDVEALDAEAIRVWSAGHLVDQERQRKEREETREKTALPWDDEIVPTVLSAGEVHACAVKKDGAVECWGLDSSGQSTPPQNLGTVKAVSAGRTHSCAIKADSTVECWGYDDFGKRTLPEELGIVQSVSTGGMHSCVVKLDGTVACWGNNIDGQRNPPSDLGSVRSVSSGSHHNCAVKLDGTVRCWGWDKHGQSTPPVDLGIVRTVSVRDFHSCAVIMDGTVACWGSDSQGKSTPPKDLGTAKAISAGTYHTCAIKADSTVECWGSANLQINPPRNLGQVKAISAGEYHTCAVKLDDSVVCWGANDSGQSSPPKGIRVWDGSAPFEEPPFYSEIFGWFLQQMGFGAPGGIK